jgi:hypothetical protein
MMGFGVPWQVLGDIFGSKEAPYPAMGAITCASEVVTKRGSRKLK